MEYLRKYSAILLVTLLATSCATTPDGNTDAGVKAVPTHKTILTGDTVRNISPLPDKKPVTVRQFFSDGHYEDGVGYVGFDFNRDGRTDMLEVMNSEGRPSTYVYDFDFDGVIDAHERVDSVQKKSQKPK